MKEQCSKGLNDDGACIACCTKNVCIILSCLKIKKKKKTKKKNRNQFVL